MFTQPCFIKKNTPELRKKLNDLGYKCNNGKWMGSFLATFKRDDSHDLFYCGTPEYDLSNNPSINNSIDCGTNEDLFLAIAALRDDTDKNQWFVNNGKWMLCDSHRVGGFIAYNDINIDVTTFHKATVEELIKHFSK